MKRSLDAAPRPPLKRERMADDASALPAPRFGFGFRAPSFSKPAANNQSENGENAGAVVVDKQEKTEPAVASAPLAEIDTNEQVVERGRGRPTSRERALSRPNMRRTPTMIKPDPVGGTTTGLQAPCSTGRIAMKLEPVAVRRASANNAATSRETAALTQRLKGFADKKEEDELSVVMETAFTDLESLFSGLFAPSVVADAQAVLQSRPKAKKFDTRARNEELMTMMRQAKTTMKAILDQNTNADAELRAILDKTKTAWTTEVSQRKKLLFQVRDLSLQLQRARQEIDGVRKESDLGENRVRDLQTKNEQLDSAVQQLGRVRAELETTNQRLQVQLQQAQKQNDELTLELRAYQTTMSDRVQLYEEKKKDLEQFYMRKDTEEDKRKSSEIERLQARLSEVREELAASNQEKETYRQRSINAEEDARQERDRSSQFEREKCTIEAQLHALEDRLSQSSTEISQLKDKIERKEQEISGLVQNLTEIQKLNAMSSSKIDTEKKELTEKIDRLQNQLREAERNEATSGALMRELRGQAEGLASAKAEWNETQRTLESRVRELELQLQNAARDLSVETGVRQMLENQNRELRNENTAVNAQTEAVRFEMKRLHSLHEEAKVKWQSDLSSVDERVEKEKAALLRQIEVLQEEKVSIESEVKTLRERAANVRDGDFEEMCNVKREAEVLRLRLQELSNHGSQSIAQKDRLIDELQEKVRQGEKLRRTLHNTIQELRGNVRVFARTRPFLPSDGIRDTESLTPAVSCEFDGQTVKLRRQAKGSTGIEQDTTYSFTFDKAFAQSSGQDNVFEEVSEFVQSAIDGYHVCLFSYGQTGSGKTHTMQGSGNGQMRGIIPRAIEKVLAECALLKDHGWNYSMKVSFLEIYNENLRDLLVTKEDAGKTLNIKKDAKGGVCVPDLTLVDVTEIEHVEKLMERASRARSVACTDMNAQSSRSHSVFTLHLQGVNDSEGIILDGQLNLVDLAGSERASRSGVSGERLKETQAINKSLSCLADVFTAIGNKSPHIPFRNSKLTYLLQSSLSGDGKTLMMVNVSPTLESAGETLCSLRFAQQVNKCELGKPKRQIKSKKDAITLGEYSAPLHAVGNLELRLFVIACFAETRANGMGPKKEKKAKKGKDKKDDGAENGGVLTPEEQVKLFHSANRSLQMQLAERHEQAVKAMESKRELQERVSALQGAFERERGETFGITQDMTRQYKSMQEELLNRVNKLENTNAELRDQLELARVNFEEMKREKDRVIGAKNVEIQELKAKMEEMAQEFGDMLKETLDKMRERIEITSTSFDHDGAGGGMPMIRRLDEFNLGSPSKLA